LHSKHDPNRLHRRYAEAEALLVVLAAHGVAINAHSQLAAGMFGSAPVKAIAGGARAVVTGVDHTCALVKRGRRVLGK